MKKYIWITLMLVLGLASGIQAKNNGQGEGKEKGDHGKSSKVHEKDKEGGKGQQKVEGDDNERKSHQKDHEGLKGEKGHRITSAEQQAFHDYVFDYQQNRKVKTLPPGLAKKVARGEALPPGWQKKIARGEVLPLVIYQQVNPLPDVLLLRLPEQPVGTHLGVIDGRIVRLADATRTILDVFNLR